MNQQGSILNIIAKKLFIGYSDYRWDEHEPTRIYFKECKMNGKDKNVDVIVDLIKSKVTIYKLGTSIKIEKRSIKFSVIIN